MTATTFETFDLLDGGSRRVSVRDSVRSPTSGPYFTRQKDSRQIRHYEFPINPATSFEVKRVNDLWNLTAFGVLPMLWNHHEDGNVAVVFDMPFLDWRMSSSNESSIVLKLKEHLG
jgi:hypothetical protein